MPLRGPVLDTPRLSMRPPRGDDFDAWAEFAADVAATRYLGGPVTRTVAWRSFLTMAGAWAVQGFAMFSVIERSSGRWIGRVGPWYPEGWPGTEVGWGIVSDCWNCGYATEAAIAAIDWVFDVLDWREVIHVIDVDNAASQAVARKLGSRNRGRGRLPAPHESAIVDIWGQSREEWRARSRSA